MLATNIAETSITLPNCSIVIDTGREKRVLFNPATNISEMKEVWVSWAAAEQRKGRAGRVCAGTVFRLFTRSRLQAMDRFTPPEMLTSPLEALCLQVLSMRLGAPGAVLAACITPPAEGGVRRALETLREIQAIEWKEGGDELLPLGRHLAMLPMDCRLGKLVIFGCLLHCVEAAVVIAAFLSQRTVFRAPVDKREEMMAKKQQFAHRESDHITLLRVYAAWKKAQDKRDFCHSNFINFESMMTVESVTFPTFS